MEALLGLLVGLAIGLTGVGAGTLTAPALVLALGLPPATAVGTALVFGAIVKCAAAPLFIRRKQVRWRPLGLMLAGGLPGALAGAWLLTSVSRCPPDGLILVVVGLTVAGCATLNLARPRGGGGIVARDRPGWLPWLGLAIGLEVGFSSAGAGALGSLALMRLTAIEPAQVVATDLLFGLLVAAAGGALHWNLGGVDGQVLLGMLAGGVPGVLLGVRTCCRLPARALGRGLSIWLVYLGGHLFYRGVELLVRG